MTNHPNRGRSAGPAFFNADNTPGYSGDGSRNLNRAREIIMEERGLDMDLPNHVIAEIDQRMRDRLTNTHGRNLSVRMLLALWQED